MNVRDHYVREDEIPEWALVEASLFIRKNYSQSIDAWWEHVNACGKCTHASKANQEHNGSHLSGKFCVVSAGIGAIISARFNSISYHSRANVDFGEE